MSYPRPSGWIVLDLSAGARIDTRLEEVARILWHLDGPILRGFSLAVSRFEGLTTLVSLGVILGR